MKSSLCCFSDDGPACKMVICGWLGKASCRSFLAKFERAHYLRLCGVELKSKGNISVAAKLQGCPAILASYFFLVVFLSPSFASFFLFPSYSNFFLNCQICHKHQNGANIRIAWLLLLLSKYRTFCHNNFFCAD